MSMHYYATKIDNSDRYSVIDTLDFTREHVKFADFCDLYFDKFINAIFLDSSIQEYIKTMDARHVEDYLLSCSHGRAQAQFKFPIKKGYVEYDGKAITIEYENKVHSIYFIPEAGFSDRQYLMFDDIILGRYRVAGSQDFLYLDGIDVILNRLYLNISMVDYEYTIKVVIDGNRDVKEHRKVMAKISGTKDSKTYNKHVSKYLISLTSYINERIKDRLPVNFWGRAYETVNLLRVAYNMESVDRCYIKQLIEAYLKCLDLGIMNFDEFMKQVISDYGNNIGFTKEQGNFVSRLFFFENK